MVMLCRVSSASNAWAVVSGMACGSGEQHLGRTPADPGDTVQQLQGFLVGLETAGHLVGNTDDGLIAVQAWSALDYSL